MGATLDKLIDSLDRRCTWRNAGIAFGVMVASNLAMGAYILPNIEARRPEAIEDGFLVMIDLAPLRSVDEVYRIFDLYQPDIMGLVRMLYAVDFVFPPALAFFAAVLIGKMLRYVGVTQGGRRALLLLPFVFVPLDYVENTLALFLSGQYVNGWRVFPTLAGVASVATTCKFLALLLAGLAMLTLLFRTGAKRMAR